MNALPLMKDATYEDLLALPDHVKAELIDGEVVCQSSPSDAHQNGAAAIGYVLRGPFHLGTGGPKDPGGWVILPEVDVFFGRNVLRPDVSGWHRIRMPNFPADRPMSLVPDWVCEVLSPSTERHDRLRKMDIFARAGVPYVWLVDPVERMLEVYVLRPGGYMRVNGAAEDEAGHFEPFDAIELSLKFWWA